MASIEEMTKIALKHLDYGFQIVKILPESVILSKDGKEYTYAKGRLTGTSGEIRDNVLNDLYGPKVVEDAKILLEKHFDEFGIIPGSEPFGNYSQGPIQQFSCGTIVEGVFVRLNANVITDTVSSFLNNPYQLVGQDCVARELVKFAKRFETIERRLAESEAQKAAIEAKLAEVEANHKKEIEELRAAMAKN